MRAGKFGGLLVGAALFVALPGCSGKGGVFVTVSGIVKYNGTPVEGAKVKFISTTESSGAKLDYSSQTDSSGKYMVAGGGTSGITPGMYKVVITKLVLPSGKGSPSGEELDPLQLEMSGLGANKLPKKYADPNTTKLTATVEPGKNEANFDLTDK